MIFDFLKLLIQFNLFPDVLLNFPPIEASANPSVSQQLIGQNGLTQVFRPPRTPNKPWYPGKKKKKKIYIYIYYTRGTC